MEASWPSFFCTQMPGGSVLSPGLLPTSCHKTGEESALHYKRGRFPQAYGQQTPKPGASWEMYSPDPSPGPAPSFPGVRGYRLLGSHPHPSPLDEEALHCVPSLTLASLLWIKEGTVALGEEKTKGLIL